MLRAHIDAISDFTHQSQLEYDSIIGTGSPDLDRFNRRGGKIITWHGLADPIIPPQGTKSLRWTRLQQTSTDSSTLPASATAEEVPVCFPQMPWINCARGWRMKRPLRLCTPRVRILSMPRAPCPSISTTTCGFGSVFLASRGDLQWTWRSGAGRVMGLCWRD